MDRVDRKMKHILLVLREPFLDRIPSLKTLVWFLLNHNHRITLITSESNKFILLSFDHENLQIIKVKQRSKRFESPTTLKLLWKTLSFVLTRRVDYLMGGDVVCQGTYRIEYFLAFGRILYLDSIIPFQNQDNL